MIFKCKMCGAQIEITDGMTVAECGYCGTQQTLPKTDNEQNLNLFNRANHFRQQCEFYKASEIYEKMAAHTQNDAELYWSIFIEYAVMEDRLESILTIVFTSFFHIYLKKWLYLFMSTAIYFANSVQSRK